MRNFDPLEILKAQKLGIGAIDNNFTRLFALKMKGNAVEKTVDWTSLIHITDALAKPVVDLKIKINPVQSGTGDPSPENIRPISGWTGANVWRTGINIYDVPSSLNSVSPTGSGNDGLRVDLPEGTYTVKPINETVYNFLRGRIVHADGTYEEYKVFSGQSASSYSEQTFTLNKGDWIFLYKGGSSYATHIISAKPAIVVGSAFPESVGSYTGTTYPITWQTEAGTVYGGELDVTTGLLTVDRKIYTFIGDNGWMKTSDGRDLFYRNKPSDLDNLGSSEFLCNIFTKATTSSKMQNEQYAIGNNYVTVRHDSTSTLTEFRQFLNRTNLTICAPLATPLTYQLTPTEVTTLLGVNNVWADTGDVSVKYWAHS